jgi:hypothetical protein
MWLRTGARPRVTENVEGNFGMDLDQLRGGQKSFARYSQVVRAKRKLSGGITTVLPSQKAPPNLVGLIHKIP